MSRRKTAVVMPDNTAETVCPHCGSTVVFKVTTPVRSSTPVRTRVRCECGRVHAVYLERRTFIRKEVDLPGVYQIMGDVLNRSMRIFNLSRTGLMFKSDDDTELAVGDRLRVDFRFGNKQITHIHKEVQVIRTFDNGVGAEFSDRKGAEPLDRLYDLALALYQPELEDRDHA